MNVTQTLERAIQLHQAGQAAEAAGFYQQVLAEEPDNVSALNNLSALLLALGAPGKAKPLLERAYGLSPGNPDIRRNLAGCLYSQGEWEQSGALVDEAQAAGDPHPMLAELRQRMQGRREGRKVFCVGRNKTGTTSLEAALASLGYQVGLQARGEMLVHDWARRDFRRLAAFCQTADAFQDVPFSYDYTYQALDMHFPGSKFILTLRASPEEWYESLVRFQMRLFKLDRLPTVEDLKRSEYRYPGFLWDTARLRGLDDTNLYDRDLYIARYLNHNRQIQEYFRHRPEDLLVLDVSAPDAMARLCRFLGIDHQGRTMPHLNRTR